MLMVVVRLSRRRFACGEFAPLAPATVWLSVKVRVLKPELPASRTTARGGSRG